MDFAAAGRSRFGEGQHFVRYPPFPAAVVAVDHEAKAADRPAADVVVDHVGVGAVAVAVGVPAERLVTVPALRTSRTGERVRASV